jgi:hypothetical protein
VAKDIRAAFFGQIRERRAALERQAQPSGTKEWRPSPTIIEEVIPPERLWDYLDYVGNFLVENGVITTGDLNLAAGLIQDYEDRLESLFPGS